MTGRHTFGLVLLLTASPVALFGTGVAATAGRPPSGSNGNQAARSSTCVDVDIAINGRTAAFHIGVSRAGNPADARLQFPFRLPRGSVFFGFDVPLGKDGMATGIPLESVRAQSIFADEVRRGNAAGLATPVGDSLVVAKVRSDSGRDRQAATFRFVAPIDPARGVSLVLNGGSPVRSCGLFVSARNYRIPPIVTVGGQRLAFKPGRTRWEASLKGNEPALAGNVTITGGTLARQAWIGWSGGDDSSRMVNPTFFVADDVANGDPGPTPRLAVTSVTDGSGRAIPYRVLPAANGRWSIVGPAPSGNPIRIGLSDGSSRTYTLDDDEFPDFGPGILWAWPLVDGLMRDPARRQEGIRLALSYRMLGPRMSYIALQKLDQYRRAGLPPPREVVLDAGREDEIARDRVPPAPPAPPPKPAPNQGRRSTPDPRRQ